MLFTQEEIDKIRENLPTSERRILLEEFKLKSGSLRNILSGNAKNDAVLMRALELANAHKEKVNTSRQMLSAL